MTPQEFTDWQRQLDLTDDQAAEALGIAPTTVRNYKRGARDGGTRSVDIPQPVALACELIAIRSVL